MMRMGVMGIGQRQGRILNINYSKYTVNNQDAIFFDNYG
jgi:hypothetical protein